MLIDTAGLLSYYSSREAEHAQAVRLCATAPRRVVHNYVLAEFVILCRVRRAPLPGALALLRAVLASPRFELHWVDLDLHSRAVDLLAARPDKNYSLCDAVSFVLMTDLGLTAALTTDHHFEQEGFTALLR